MKLSRIISIPLILIVLVFSIYISSHHEKSERVIERTRFSMGTMVEIKVSIGEGDEKKDVEQAIDKAFREIDRVEDAFSVFKKDSEISKINELKGAETLKVQDEVFDLIEKSIEYNKKTNGAFDITVKPLVDLWRRAKDEKKMPADSDIKDALTKVGSQDIVLDEANKTISFKKDGMALDLGGIAKGYATDKAIKILKENGIRNAIVNSGGDMYCLGRKSERELWKVGIQHPRKRNEIFLEIGLEDKAIDTSGDYEKFFILDGKRFSHIIDPRTGYPIGDDVVSATCIAKDSVTADALATALSVLGRDGLNLLKSMGEDIDAVLVFKEGDRLKVEMSGGIKKRYDIIEKKSF